MKFAIFWERRFNDNNFCNLKISKDLSPFKELKQILKDEIVSINIIDDYKEKEQYVILCFLNFSIFNLIDYIKLFIKYPKNKKYFFIFEPKIVCPMNYNKIIHYFFTKIYTRNDELIDNKKYFKYIYPSSLNGYNNRVETFQNRKLITLINGNKFSFRKNELYSQRDIFIRFCEKNNIEFDLYGTNWDKKNFKQKILGFKKYTSYRGRVNNKIETLSKYKFNICFENMQNTPGYITEKIWDSFKAKTVPIYWGASNITKYIPESCFIDFRKFNGDYNLLIEYITKITENEYNRIINNIDDFMQTERAQKWFDKKWATDFAKSLDNN